MPIAHWFELEPSQSCGVLRKMLVQQATYLFTLAGPIEKWCASWKSIGMSPQFTHYRNNHSITDFETLCSLSPLGGPSQDTTTPSPW